jgi:exonuclease SbcD
MKILATADWHLGAYVGPQCDDPMKRMENTIKCLDVLVETARREGPDIILVCGDIFHSSRIWNDRCMQEYRVVVDYLSVLGRMAPVMVLFGTPNHDPVQSFYALEEHFSEMKYPYVRFFTKPEIVKVDCKSGPIQVAGLPGFDKGHFRAQFPGLSAEEENLVFTQQLALVVQGLSAQVDSTIPSVLMAHHTVVGCELDNGTHVFQANEVVLDAATLDNSNFDLVCLGHIHKAQRVDVCSRPVYYSGSIDANTFNDEGHAHGFWMHDIDQLPFGRDHHRADFIATPAREFLTCRWPEDGVKSYIEFGADAFAWDVITDKVVRVLCTCDSETEKALDKKKLERDLYAAGAYYVSEIRPEKVTASVNMDRMHEKLTVEDCLQRYLGEKKMTPDDIALLFELASGIITQAQASSPMGTTSGLFLPVEIEVRNYRSYAEEKLSFEDIFFAMVNGKNGSGKSSLFMDAITDCLYEETREKELTGWIRNREKSGSIIFTFKLGVDLWRVTRTRQRSGKATLALAKLEGDFDWDKGIIGIEDITEKWIDHSCERMVDTQQKIIDLLGMDCDTFQSCVLIMQDRYGKFMEASKEDRMNVLASLLGLGIYDELEKLAKDKLTDINRAIKTLKTEIEKLEIEVKAEEDLRIEGAQIEVSLACANDDLKAAREELAGYQVKLAAMDGYVKEAADLEKDIESKTTAHTDKKKRKEKLESDVFTTESFLKNEQNILDRCAELDSTRLAIASLDGKVQLLNDKKARCGKVNLEDNQLRISRNNISNQLKVISDSLQDKERLQKLVDGRTVEQDLEVCEKKAQEYKNLDNTLVAAETQLSFHNEKINNEIASLDFKIKTLTKQTEMLGNTNCVDILNAHCKFLQSAKEAKAEIESVLKEKQKIIVDGAIKRDQLNDSVLRLQSQRDAVGYDALSHNVLIQSAKEYREAKDKLAKMAADSATADGLFEKYTEQGEKLNELAVELKSVTDEIAVLESETGSYEALHAKVNELLPAETEKGHLPRAKQFVESSNKAIEQLAADLAGLAAEIEKQNKKLVELQGLTGNRDVLRQCIRDDEQTIKVIESDISTLNQSIGTINAKLQFIAGQKEQLKQKQAELSASAKQASQLQVLVEAFSQDGIPYQIIRDIVPELEAAANEILGQMTGGRMRLEFITEKVLKSNKAKEIATLEIIIIDVDNGVLPYLSRSGGQKVRAALAVNFALANIKASRVGLQLGMMFVDEPPFLDADGVEAYCAALEIIHNKYPEMKLLAISHDENMKSMFPQQLYVDVTENGSKVRRL